LPKKVETFWSTYAIASEIAERVPWYKNSLIWETARPYLYMRTTDDNRIIVGGKDDKFSNPIIRDQRLDGKSRELTKSFEKLFPEKEFRRDFAWAGTFASTRDGLPYIGKIPQRPNTWFALGFGGNGITFSAIAAEIIRDELCDKTNNGTKLFSFVR
jgi:glycine/D-amino acid oxidase-like deaminating enzyme